MKIEIWSDIQCPFCYIGKRHFEQALDQFNHKDNLQIEWKSFQLDPTIPEAMEHIPTVYQYLADRKGMPIEESADDAQNVTEMAQRAGLEYNFDHVHVANSLRAHRIIQKAKEYGLDDMAEEVFFKAYFIDGKNLGDTVALMELGEQAGLTQEQVSDALENDLYAYAVNQDIKEADSLGIRGVPFFVFDRKYGISGAQPVELFVKTLNQAYQEWDQGNTSESIAHTGENACSIDGTCE